MVHELKTWPQIFKITIDGIKKAEFRKNDRDFRVGDDLILKEYEPNNRTYTGRKVIVKITHILYGPNFGIPYDYCMISHTMPSDI